MRTAIKNAHSAILMFLLCLFATHSVAAYAQSSNNQPDPLPPGVVSEQGHLFLLIGLVLALFVIYYVVRWWQTTHSKSR